MEIRVPCSGRAVNTYYELAESALQVADNPAIFDSSVEIDLPRHADRHVAVQRSIRDSARSRSQESISTGGSGSTHSHTSKTQRGDVASNPPNKKPIQACCG